MSTRSPVVIVGAGPAGLAVACALWRLGVAARVIDRCPTTSTGSRAIVLWPQAQELLDEIGVLDRARAEGLRAEAMVYRLGSSAPTPVELDPADQPLLLPQERTTTLLEGALRELGGTVERSVRLVDVAQDEHGVALRVVRAEGAQETIETAWVIGADGVGSTVRPALGIGFPGAGIPATFLLAEGEVGGTIDDGLDPTRIHYHLHRDGPLLVAPLPGGRARVCGTVPAGTEPTEEAARRLLAERGPGDLTLVVTSGAWLFHSEERIADRLRVGRAFLVGDAAHVHSAAGGQGLNLGIADGRNLAWKLAGVIHGRWHPAVLDSYDPERRAAAEQVLAATGRMVRMAMLGPVAARLRDAGWAVLRRTGALRRRLGPALAGRHVSYPDVLFGSPARRSGPRRPWPTAPRPGSRGPDDLGPAAGTHLRLVTLPSGGAHARARRIGERHRDLVVHETADRLPSDFVLVRPDGFVAAAGAGADLDVVDARLGLLTAP